MNYEGLYSEMVAAAPNEARFVEVGSWVGRSACYLGVEIVNSGKNIKLDCVDTWLGAPELMEEDVVKNRTLYSDFIRNTEPLKDIITPVRLCSMQAARLYEDESIYFAFIDGDHSREGFGGDLRCWYPKVKPGGVIAGHDYDYPEIKGYLHEFFKGKEIEVILPNTWVFRKK